MEIRDRVRMIRKKTGLSQQEFSRQIGVGQSTLAQFETGRRVPKDIHIKAICSAFGINEQWLATGRGDMTPELDVVDRLNQAENLEQGDIELIQRYIRMPLEKRRAFREMLLALGEAAGNKD